MAELYKGIAGSPITYLASDISAAQTTISIADDSALPDAPNIATIGYGEQLETIKYGIKSNGVLQEVVRGVEGIPRAWQAGTEVARFFTAYDHNSIIEEFIAHKAESVNDNVHGLGWSEYTELTLLNGWSGVLRLRKNGMGLVWIYGEITPGVTERGTTIATLPLGYRPPQVTALSAQSVNISTGGLTGIAITTAGNLNIYGDAAGKISTQNVRINYVYKAV